MIPGAGFPPGTIERFARFRDRRFGVRVQMVLNDQHVRPRFLAVNAALDPDIVIFNSEAWPPGSYRDFSAKQFHHLIGAVDVGAFSFRSWSPSPDHFVIGAQISKNPAAMLEALDLLPPQCAIRFFGVDRHNVWPHAKGRWGPRVEYVGPIFGEALADYYQHLDAMVSAESYAGWANVVAEAMCAGVPVVTTRAGTLSMANKETAIVIDAPSGEAIAEGLTSILRNPGEAQNRCRSARARIEQFDWKRYSDELIRLIAGFDGKAHYTYAPHLGLYGKAQPEERLEGLDSDLARVRGKTVLDLGAAEGLISHECVARDAARVDAVEADSDRVAFAKATFSGVRFEHGELCSEEVRRSLAAACRPGDTTSFST